MCLVLVWADRNNKDRINIRFLPQIPNPLGKFHHNYSPGAVVGLIKNTNLLSHGPCWPPKPTTDEGTLNHFS